LQDDNFLYNNVHFKIVFWHIKKANVNEVYMIVLHTIIPKIQVYHKDHSAIYLLLSEDSLKPSFDLFITAFRSRCSLEMPAEIPIVKMSLSTPVVGLKNCEVLWFWFNKIMENRMAWDDDIDLPLPTNWQLSGLRMTALKQLSSRHPEKASLCLSTTTSAANLASISETHQQNNYKIPKKKSFNPTPYNSRVSYHSFMGKEIKYSDDILQALKAFKVVPDKINELLWREEVLEHASASKREIITIINYHNTTIRKILRAFNRLAFNANVEVQQQANKIKSLEQKAAEIILHKRFKKRLKSSRRRHNYQQRRLSNNCNDEELQLFSTQNNEISQQDYEDLDARTISSPMREDGSQSKIKMDKELDKYL